MVASAVATTRMRYEQSNSLPNPMLSQPFMTDAYRVKAAITNLVRNACLHSEARKFGAPRLWEWMRRRRSSLCWTVGDNGKGIPDYKLPTLFKPFERGESAAEGTGLGLHIAKTWIEELYGELKYARTQQGSEFVLRIPFNKISGEHHLVARPSSTATQKDSTESLEQLAGRLRLLYVEDDRLIQQVTAHILKPLFAEVQIVADGNEGLQAAQEDYDIILTDYFMPNLTGAEMTETLRSQGDERPIIAVTAATIGNEADELLQAGVDRVLPKPLNKKAVLKALGEFAEAGVFLTGGRGGIFPKSTPVPNHGRSRASISFPPSRGGHRGVKHAHSALSVSLLLGSLCAFARENCLSAAPTSRRVNGYATLHHRFTT